MAGSWHDFLYGSFDAKGLMTVDKPPLALWVEALSVKLFGFNSLAILVPQALMGVASVGLLYDLTRRRWGRAAGTVAGLALALTPVVVAISRHNNPDALLVLCSVGALWCFVRALEHGATKWLVRRRVCVGLGFEAKMGAALMVVPGMALAWLWVAPRGRLVAIRQLAFAGAALVAVALAWPVLVWLTPAASRPWISGTSDNSIWSLIWEYNGLGRLEGQTGGPGIARRPAAPSAARPAPFRLLNEALGGQAGWLLGAALGGRPRDRRAQAPAPDRPAHRLDHRRRRRLRHHRGRLQLRRRHLPPVLHVPARALRRGPGRRDRGTGAGGGAGGRRRSASAIVGAVAIGLGAIVELVVIDNSASDLDWLVVPLVIVAVAAVGGLLFADSLAARSAAVERRGAIRLAALACGRRRSSWSARRSGRSTRSATRPAAPSRPAAPNRPRSMGGPGGGGGSGGMTGAPGRRPAARRASAAPKRRRTDARKRQGDERRVGELFGEARAARRPAAGGPRVDGAVAAAAGCSAAKTSARSSNTPKPTAAGRSPSTASPAPPPRSSKTGAEVAGIGGFSGKESAVSADWLEERIESGAITWIYTSGLGSGIGGGGPGGGQSSGGPGGDTRTGSESAIDTVVKSCTKVDSSAYSSTPESRRRANRRGSGTLYRCGDS